MGSTACPSITCDRITGSDLRSIRRSNTGSILPLARWVMPPAASPSLCREVGVAVAVELASDRVALAKTTISTGRLPPAWISSTSRRAPSAGGIRPRPSRSNIGLSAPVTMPPSQGPQLNDTTRHADSRRAVCWAHLLSHSLAAA